MDELDVVLRARRVSRQLTSEQTRLALEPYLRAMPGLPDNIVLRFDRTLGEDEAGNTVVIGGKRCITINGNDRPERQRFTACHEVAHILLGIPTEHDNAGTQFARRSLNETLCDVFAAELLLPYHLFRPLVDDSDLGFPTIERLAAEFTASLAATGSRFAAVQTAPCAFVLTQGGTIRYAARSKTLRESGAFVRPAQAVPETSLTWQCIRSSIVDGPMEISADEWFEDWTRGGVLQEDVRHFPRWNQTLTLLWFEDDRIPSSSSDYVDDDDDEEPALRPLDGVLPWPGKSRRRR